jgi:hypothetical protein
MSSIATRSQSTLYFLILDLFVLISLDTIELEDEIFKSFDLIKNQIYNQHLILITFNIMSIFSPSF